MMLPRGVSGNENLQRSHIAKLLHRTMIGFGVAFVVIVGMIVINQSENEFLIVNGTDESLGFDMSKFRQRDGKSMLKFSHALESEIITINPNSAIRLTWSYKSGLYGPQSGGGPSNGGYMVIHSWGNRIKFQKRKSPEGSSITFDSSPLYRFLVTYLGAVPYLNRLLD